MKRLFLILASLLFICGCGIRALPASAAADVSRPLLILMYHSILKDPARAGKYVLSPDDLESDIVWLIEHGYTSVTLGQLVDFADGRGGLPDKPVLLTFDDGYYNNLSYVLPLLTEYDFCAVIAIVGEYSRRYTDEPDPNPNYAYLGRDDISALALSDRIEFANHSYAMHAQSARLGSSRLPGESDADYARAFTADAQRCEEFLSSCRSAATLAYAYPFGVVEPASTALIQSLGLRVSLTCREMISTVARGEPDSLFCLGRYNRPSGVSTEAFFSALPLSPPEP